MEGFMQRIYKMFAVGLVGVFLFALTFSPVAVAQDVNSGGGTPPGGNERFLTFPTWYRGLPRETDGGVKLFDGEDGISKTIWVIALNIVEVIIQLVGYISVIYIMIGGYRYLLSNGSPDGNVRGRKTILNAIIGLIIAIASVAIVNTVVGSL